MDLGTLCGGHLMAMHEAGADVIVWLPQGYVVLENTWLSALDGRTGSNVKKRSGFVNASFCKRRPGP